jgi:dTDP-4-dehydrorhamnose reductase
MGIAVTGSGGQLGGELCRRLGPRAIGLDLPDFDLTCRETILDVLEKIRPEAVVNTAAFTQVDKAEQEVELCRRINAEGVAHLVEACTRLDCPLLQVSTDYVFGGNVHRTTPYRETDDPAPQGVYAQTKAESEACARAWSKHFIVRSCGLYGQPAPRTAGNFVATMLRLAAEGRPLRVVDDQRCTPSYVPHVARAILFLLGTRSYGTYHVVNTGETTWYRFAQEILRQAGLAVGMEAISTAQYGARAPRPAYSVLDTSKYHALPGRPAMPSWREALAEHLAAISDAP